MSDDQVVDQIEAASASDVPRMASPESGEVKLLRGLYDADNDQWHDTAHVRELTGADEEYLSDLSDRKGISYVEYLSGFLDRAVATIGTLPAKGLINKLILPDRDTLFLGIVKATYGKEREVQGQCPECGHKQGIVLELDVDFPVVGLDRDFRTPIEVPMSKGTAQFRYPNGEDTIYASSKADNVAHMNTLIIARCVVSEAPYEESIEWARDLGLADRRKVDTAILDATDGVGPQLGEVDTRCAECNEEITLRLDWVSLLLG